MEADRMRILKMLREGRITPEQANDLLIALGSPGATEAATGPAAPQPPEGSRQPEGPTPPEGQRPPERAGRDWASLGRDIAARVVEGLPQSLGDLSSSTRRHNFSEMRLTRKKLSRFEDGTKYVNFGKLTVADDVTEDLLAAKIRDYINFGVTTGPANLVDALEEVCLNNFGRFIASGDAEGDEEGAEEGDWEADEEQVEEAGQEAGVGMREAREALRESKRQAKAAARDAKHQAKAAAREAKAAAREAKAAARKQNRGRL